MVVLKRKFPSAENLCPIIGGSGALHTKLEWPLSNLFPWECFRHSHTWGREAYSFHFNQQHAIVIVPVLARKLSLVLPAVQVHVESFWLLWLEHVRITGSAPFSRFSALRSSVLFTWLLSVLLHRSSPACLLWVRYKLSHRHSFASQGMTALRVGQKIPLKRAFPKVPWRVVTTLPSTLLAPFLWAF